MARTITFSIQKGGVGKTTTAGICATLLSKEHDVLAIDMDSQGNLTQLLTGVDDLAVFEDRTILEALKENEPDKYIVELSESLHLLPADDYLATISRWMYSQKHTKPHLLLDRLLEPISHRYDYIIIDTPPALSDQTINALCASHYFVAVCESSKFCYNALPRFIATGEEAKKHNPRLKMAGILRTLNDNRRKDAQAISEVIEEEYGESVFKTIINRKAATGRLPIYGFGEDNKELLQATGQHKQFLEELIERVK